jgi:hypothetical protein
MSKRQKVIAALRPHGHAHQSYPAGARNVTENRSRAAKAATAEATGILAGSSNFAFHR